MANPRRPQAGADEGRNPNVFDDEYAVDVPETELDHRPLARSAGQEPEVAAPTRSRAPSYSRSDRRSISNKEAAERSTPPRTVRSSIAKDPRDFGAGGRSSSGNNAERQSYMRNRPISTASEFAHFEDRFSTPVQGRGMGGGIPSQFSNSGLPRSSFVSHSPPRMSSVHTQAVPAHPYGLYNQTTIPGDDDNSARGTGPIGFSVRDNDFERRIGPDGEEQDILGPDGHTEALPPYSRYPDGATKTVAIPLPTAQQNLSPVRQNSASLPIDEAQRTPNLEAAALGPSASNSESSLSEKKAWRNKTFTEKRRTKVCWGCIPLWMLLTILAAFLLAAVAVAGTVGGLIAEQKKNKPPTVTVTSTASMLDASPIATPTGIPPLPTGAYTLPFGIPQEQQKSCLTDPTQYNTWACNTPSQPILVRPESPSSHYQTFGMAPNVPPQADGTPGTYNFSYGAQYPIVMPAQRLFWVVDLEEPSQGPALHFQTMYDKIVILNDDQFSPPSNKKRQDEEGPEEILGEESAFSTTSPDPFNIAASPTPAALTFSAVGEQPTGGPPGGFRHKKNQVSTGDQPWFCFWNQTWLEGFVYVKTFVPPNPDKHKLDRRDDGEEPYSPTTTIPPTYDGSLPKREIHPEDPDFAEAQEMYQNAMKRMASASSPSNMPSTTCFPYVMKIQERRIPGGQSVKPYCQKMLIPPEGPPVPILDSTGNPVRVAVQENSASFQAQQSGIKASTSSSSVGKRDMAKQPKQLIEMMKRQDAANDCHCLWVTPPPPS